MRRKGRVEGTGEVKRKRKRTKKKEERLALAPRILRSLAEEEVAGILHLALAVFSHPAGPPDCTPLSRRNGSEQHYCRN